MHPARCLQAPEAGNALDRALCALRALHDEVGPEAARLRAARRGREASVAAVKVRLGSVFRHRRTGYRGVVFGWDAQCRPGPYATKPDVEQSEHAQPFYYALPDENDAVR